MCRGRVFYRGALIGDVMDTFFITWWNSFSGSILEMLPDSPTIDSEAMAAFADIAGYLNYFIPVGRYVTFLSVFLTAVSGYYGAMVIMRWMRLIQ